MNASDRYIPKKGDIVWVNFDPSSGNEIKKRRPGLVVSRYEFNRSTLFAVICPITSTIKNIPTRYTLPKEMVVTGQIVISQLKSLDFHARKIEFADRLPVQDIAKVDQIIEYIFKIRNHLTADCGFFVVYTCIWIQINRVMTNSSYQALRPCCR